jgi:hypothetical protein
MGPRIRDHIRSNVIGYLALFIALSGTAYAVDGPLPGQDQVGSADIINDDVQSVDIGNGSIATGDIRADAVVGGKILNGTVTGADVNEGTVNGSGDVSGTLSDLELGPGTVGRSELASGAPQGCCVGSYFEFSVPANGCTDKVESFPEANLGEVLIAFPESADLGSGVYIRPTVVAHPGQVVFQICNSTGSPVTIPFGTFFDFRLIG